jgi:hypothetical protein
MEPDGAEPCPQYTAIRKLVEQMAEAIDHGEIDSCEIDTGEGPPHKWHEEWRHLARQALQHN